VFRLRDGNFFLLVRLLSRPEREFGVRSPAVLLPGPRASLFGGCMKGAYAWGQVIGGLLLVGAVIAILVGAVCAIPAFALWSMNTLAEQGRFGWHIPHNGWTYVATYGALFTLGAFRIRTR
jgi:hypothetical protein